MLPSSPYGSFLAVSVQAFAGRESSNRHSRFKKKKKRKNSRNMKIGKCYKIGG